LAAVTASGVLLTAGSAAAQVLTTSAPPAAPAPTVQNVEVRLVEWDLPPSIDMQAGAMMVDSHGRDTNRVWFVTRLGAPPRVVRFDPARSLMKGLAKWTAWDLSEFPAPSFTGGLKKLRTSHDRRFIFVRTQNNLQRIDTGRCNCTTTPQTCERTVWADQLGDNTSDVAIDDRNNVFTTYSPTSDPASSYVQMLRPGAAVDGVVKVKRWQIGATGPSGAGFCQGAAASGPCVSGIAVHPDYRNLLYFSEPAGNNIAELDISTGNLRRWSLTEAGAALGTTIREPRQLQIDKYGKVWAVTGSGHLVSLNTRNNYITAHQMPSGAPVAADVNDPYAVAPDDDVVGYTASGQSRVGMLVPSGRAVCVYPKPFCPLATFQDVVVKADRAPVQSGTAQPVGKRVQGQITRKTDGTFVEAIINSNLNDSELPLGITPNKSKAQGTFFYGVGVSTNVRIGFARLPVKQRLKCARDDDDTDDGWDSEHARVGHHHGEIEDDDDDGLYNEHDAPTTHEKATTSDPEPLQAGASRDYAITATSASLALLATATAQDDPLGQVVVDLLNSIGAPVGTQVVAPGTATTTLLAPSPGNYTARVRNLGIKPFSHMATLTIREAWNLVDAVEPALGSSLLPAPVEPIDPWP
jgi:streptogramin lyase